MNTAPILTVWLQLIGLLAGEVALLTTAVALLQRSTKSAWWRRTLWQVCLLSLLALPLLELSGAARGAAGWLERKIRYGNGGSEIGIAAARSSERVPAPSLTDKFRRKVAEQFALNHQRETSEPSKMQTSATPAQAPLPQAGPVTAADSMRNPIRIAPPESFSVLDSVGVPWLGLIWLTGAGLVIARSCVARLLFALFRRRRRAVRDADLQNRAEALARLLGINRRVRLVELARLNAPIVFGLLWPAIGLPAEFTQRFDTPRQEAMLAHELAHLTANDPFWYLLADLTAAIFWWHPCVWWARRRLHTASETAADEASLLLANGPGVLAECLVELGAQLMKQRSLVWLSVEGTGFRSGLGRRVERLVNLRGRSWCRPGRLRSIFAKTIGPAALIAVVILCTAWVGPRALTKGESMKTMKQTWKRSLAALALLASLGTDNNIAPAASADDRPIDKKAAPANAKSTPADDKPAAPDLASDPSAEESSHQTPYYYYNRMMMERYGLTPKGAPLPDQKASGPIVSKLGKIVLNEVMFDDMPLPEVLKLLDEESRKRDPDKLGINFLINPNATEVTTPTAIDPNTGQPIQSPPSEPLDMNSVIVRFNLPLRNVRLKDVLDAVVKVADKPIEYSIEDYGVVFSQSSKQSGGSAFMPAAGATEPTPLQVRTFKVDADKLLPGMERAFGISLGKSDAESRDRKPASPDTNLEQVRQDLRDLEKRLAELRTQYTEQNPKVVEQRAAIDDLKEQLKRRLSGQDGKVPETQVALRRLLTQLGINMDVPGKAVFYNDLTGIIMVRATAEDLAIVQAAIETLGGSTGESAASPGSAGDGTTSFSYNEDMMRRYGLLPPKK